MTCMIMRMQVYDNGVLWLGDPESCRRMDRVAEVHVRVGNSSRYCPDISRELWVVYWQV